MGGPEVILLKGIRAAVPSTSIGEVSEVFVPDW
jgi:hypothetical protein